MGSLMFVKDHINLMGDNPLRGKNYEELGPRFPDMLKAYDKNLLKIGEATAVEIGIPFHTGIHASVSGPTFETLAEVDMLRVFGADTIGMSMIPEIIVAAHAGIKAMGIVCVTDIALPDNFEPITHELVLEVTTRIRPTFIKLVSGIVERIPG